MKLQIPAKALRAASYCMARGDMRTYLNGVLLDVTGPSEGYVVSTSGAILFAGRVSLEYLESPQTAPHQIIIPAEVIKGLTKKADWFVLEALSDGRYMLDGKVFKAIDGKFPDYWRVIPRQQESIKQEAPAQFNPVLMGACVDAIRAFYGLKKDSLQYGILQCGTQSCVVYGEDASAVAVCMPFHKKGFDYNYHGLLSPTQSFEQAA